MVRPASYFDLTKTRHAGLYEGCELVWEALKRLPDYIQTALTPGILGRVLPGAHLLSEQIEIGTGTVVEPGVVMKGAVIVGADCEIRAGAYLRGPVIVGDGVVVGHATELKGCVLHNGAAIPHFAYVGDSLLGHKAHLGAGVKISNLKLVPGPITVTADGKSYNTGLVKFGAVVGDYVDIGCNAVLSPGSLIGRESIVYANAVWRGHLPPRSIAKLRQTLVLVSRRPK